MTSILDERMNLDTNETPDQDIRGLVRNEKRCLPEIKHLHLMRYDNLWGCSNTSMYSFHSDC